MLYRSFICNCRADNELLLLVVHGGSKMIVPRWEGGIVVWIPDCLFFLTLIRDCLEIKKSTCIVKNGIRTHALSDQYLKLAP